MSEQASRESLEIMLQNLVGPIVGIQHMSQESLWHRYQAEVARVCLSAQPLGAEFETAIFDDLETLYED